MNLDLVSVSIMSALVINVSGIVFLVETLIRRDEGAGRIWALAFLAGMLTTLAYLVWAYDSSAWWAIAIGNAAFVANAGCMWLGCRSYNDRRMTGATLAVVGMVVATFLAAFLRGPDGGDWAGALWMFVGLIVFAGVGAAEALRGEMGGIRTAWGLAFVLGLEAVYCLVRMIVFRVAGPESELFQVWFSTVSMSFVTVTLTIVALVVTSVLRSRRAQIRGYMRASEIEWPDDGVLPSFAFTRALQEVALRAERRSELVAVIAVRIDDLEQISTAFGGDVVRSVIGSWRTGVRRYAPSSSLVGEDGPDGLVVGVVSVSAADARRQAAQIYRGLFEELGSVTDGIIPVVGVGVALSDTSGFDIDELVRVARDAATSAALSVESSVLVGEAVREDVSRR
ncbi:hypothetical protein ASD65_00835 [Microbacterium sp. Root61]|uniref:diguanylate cyclase n=1 Tax=Microbacterium sp. Root61 TaxID=1736570 RepID=UPI0006FBE681|nr:diguanylate cyclase [Microbacterium sp. Root61]KRA23122.1 hypothetical protein ASD65_00835 [Microbacterium sp. Root61]